MVICDTDFFQDALLDVCSLLNQRWTDRDCNFRVTPFFIYSVQLRILFWKTSQLYGYTALTLGCRHKDENAMNDVNVTEQKFVAEVQILFGSFCSRGNSRSVYFSHPTTTQHRQLLARSPASHNTVELEHFEHTA